MKKIFILLLFWTNFVHATNYYVSQGAAGTNSGTLANPWNSFSSVNQSLLQPGDFLYVECGKKYTSMQITWTRSGITITSYGTGAKPMFWGNGSTRPYLFYFNNVSNNVIKNIQIVDTTISATDRSILSKIQRAITFDGNSNNNIVDSCYFDRVGLAVYFNGGSNTFRNSEITNGRMIVNTAQDSDGDGIFGEPGSVSQGGDQPGNDDDYGANAFVISSSGNTFTGNYVHDCWANSFDYNYDGGNDLYCPSGTCGGNNISYNTFYDSNGVLEFTGNSPGNIITYNKFVQCESVMYFQRAASYNYLGNVFANNVCVETTLGRLAEPRLIGRSGTLAAGSLLVYNNIFNLSSSVDVASGDVGITHDNNIYKVSNGSVAGWTLTGSELSTSATLFTATTGNPLTWNYYLSSSSPARNFGKSLGYSRDFAGNTVVDPPNAGILEDIAPTLTAASSFTPITCNGGTSTVTVTASNGTAPYFGTGSFTRSAGAYSYTVTDGAGNTSTTAGTITQPAAISATATAGTIACNGGTTTVTVTATGGTGSLSGTGTFTRSAGAYSYTVTDANGCTATVSGTITQPASLIASASAGTIVSPAVTTTVTITATGGTAPYTGIGTFTRGPGAYSYTVTDARGCTSTVIGTIAAPTPTVRTFILKGLSPLILKPGN